MTDGRLGHALAAFLREEFGASVGAIVGFLDILLEDAQRQELDDVIPDLRRMRQAGEELSTLIALAVDPARRPVGEGVRLRHDLRTPLNAIKGYGELLVEEARDSGLEALLGDLSRVLELADRLLGDIDRTIEVAAAPSVDVISHVLQTIKPLGEADIRDPDIVGSHLLVVDDNASNRDLLSRYLEREGHRVTAAADAEAAFGQISNENFDLILLDLMMPRISGFEALCRLKSQESTRHIPVIMISALDELDSTVRCIQAGAEDYLPKPIHPILLRARIVGCLQKKRLLDQLRVEKQRSETLLLNVLPHTIVTRMREGERVIADRIPEATVLFSDLVDFTSISAKLPPEQTINLLGLLFSRFDLLAAQYRIEKIKTTGDGYVAAGGLLETRTDHAVAVADMAFAMLEVAETVDQVLDQPLRLRIGLHSGPLIAGVIETHRLAYDIWGDTVNTAKRMETYGLAGHVHVSDATRQALGDAFRFEPRGALDIKGKGPMKTYFLYRHR